ncbi:intracellular short-chain-length polyhydroxyalkanoate depolymerase [Tenuibacillus multivorans]|uniref:Pimeloyl-ACP methyl ester carboxylesterase n=1 Tax=Tenuibacillus multivorans TaxID=237069 RepID=A0A1H0G1Z0_9BACI|nr:alpha/beta hydrolase [Tenuibacillus multivorans]GEL78114.1 3-oxoadipate enol-lactonase [Tenuibacillus multivorans]SDO00905.1 Pimeloyl-ACP methyl ester carboxylesterase [Tenuibacillus multivorans]
MVEVELSQVALPNGENVAYRGREGGEKVVLLIHGNMTSSKHWDLLMDVLDSQYKLYAIDLPGFGESTYHNEIRSIRDLSKTVKQFIEALGLEPYALIGWSMGGAVSLQYCADYDHPCEKLVLLASGSTRGFPFYGTGSDGLPDLSHRLKTLHEVRQDTGKTQAVQGAYDRQDKEFLKMMWNQLIYVHNQPDEVKYDEYLNDMLTQRNLAEIYQALNIFNISHQHNGLSDGTGEVDQIDIPVLVMRGENDLVVTEPMTNELLEDLGERATFKLLESCGHSPLVDDLKQLRHTIEDFLTN